MIIQVTSDGTISWLKTKAKCALGQGGVKIGKKEGDGVTPVGIFPLRRVFYRPDRLNQPVTRLPVQALKPTDGWCDDPSDPQYNRYVPLPYPAHHENLWREDQVYDVIVILGHNDDPIIPGLGSAIFMHVARKDYSPTAGCVALALPDLLSLLKDCQPGDTLSIK